MRKLLWTSIKFSSEYKHITRVGRKISTQFFIFFNLQSSDFRLGVVASRKVGNAVCRNRAKRLLRAAFSEIYKHHMSRTVLIAKPAILNANYDEIVNCIRRTL